MLGRRDRAALVGAAYEDRNETLRLIGFVSYRAYLKSKLWAIIKARAFDLLGVSCVRCRGRATQIHHAIYSRDTLTGEDVRGLVPLCGGCHGRASTTSRASKARRRDGIRAKALHDTNTQLARRLRVSG